MQERGAAAGSVRVGLKTEARHIGDVLLQLQGASGTVFAPLSQVIRGVALHGWVVRRQGVAGAIVQKYTVLGEPWRLNDGFFAAAKRQGLP